MLIGAGMLLGRFVVRIEYRSLFCRFLERRSRNHTASVPHDTARMAQTEYAGKELTRRINWKILRADIFLCMEASQRARPSWSPFRRSTYFLPSTAITSRPSYEMGCCTILWGENVLEIHAGLTLTKSRIKTSKLSTMHLFSQACKPSVDRHVKTALLFCDTIDPFATRRTGLSLILRVQLKVAI